MLRNSYASIGWRKNFRKFRAACYGEQLLDRSCHSLVGGGDSLEGFVGPLINDVLSCVGENYFRKKRWQKSVNGVQQPQQWAIS